MADHEEAGGSGLTDAQEQRLRRQLKKEADAILFRSLTLDARLQAEIRKQAGLSRPSGRRVFGGWRVYGRRLISGRQRLPWWGWAVMTTGAAAALVLAVSLRMPGAGPGPMAGPAAPLVARFAADKAAAGSAAEIAAEAAMPADEDMGSPGIPVPAAVPEPAPAAEEPAMAAPAEAPAASPKRAMTDRQTLSASVALAGEATDFDPDEDVALRVILTNGTDTPLLLGPRAPTLKVIRMGWGEARDLPVAALAGRRLAPGEAVSVEAVVSAGLEPGWYAALLDGVEVSDGSRMGFGSANRLFFVRFPPGEVRLGTLPVGKSAKHAGVTLTVDEVAWTERETRVVFRIPDAAAPAGFDLVLVVDGTRQGNLDLSYRGIGGGIRGEAVFAPMPAATRSLAVEMTEFSGQVAGGMVAGAGPWRIGVFEKGAHGQ